MNIRIYPSMALIIVAVAVSVVAANSAPRPAPRDSVWQHDSLTMRHVPERDSTRRDSIRRDTTRRDTTGKAKPKAAHLRRRPTRPRHAH